MRGRVDRRKAGEGRLREGKGLIGQLNCHLEALASQAARQEGNGTTDITIFLLYNNISSLL